MFCDDVENDTLIFHLLLVCRNTDFYILTLFSVTLIIISSDNFLIDHLGLLQNPSLGDFCKGPHSKYSGVIGPIVAITTTPFCLVQAGNWPETILTQMSLAMFQHNFTVNEI